MKSFLSLLAAALSLAAAAQAQTFTIGPRISNYSTDLDFPGESLKTGRQVAFGLAGDYRSGAFVLDFNWDHDQENGMHLTDLIVDTSDYARNRGEVTVGYAAAPFLDLQGGVRLDSIRIGGASIFGSSVLTDLDIDHQALTAGLRLHSGDNDPAGFYILGRGYIGSAKLNFSAAPTVDTDTSGYRGEAGIPIRLGESNWRVVPGAEYEHIEMKDYPLRINTNRLFLNFIYRSR